MKLLPRIKLSRNCFLVSSFQFIIYYVDGLYSSKSTLPFVGLQHMQQWQVNGCTICIQYFNPNEWGLKNSLRSVGLNPCPLDSSALTIYHCSHTITIVHYLQWNRLMWSLWDWEKQKHYPNGCVIFDWMNELT